MSRALCLIRSEPHYRAQAFMQGLRAAGLETYSAFNARFPEPKSGDALVTWNRYGHGGDLANRFERAGAAVIVAENGYLGHHYDPYAKPFTADGDQLYALALWQHNGAGQWWTGEPERWRRQGISIKSWRKDGEHILVLPQRGIGPRGVAMPQNWPQEAVKRLRTMTSRPVRLRGHPGNHPAKTPLEADLAECWAAVTWGSGAALKAICAGVPVFSDFPKWIGFSATCGASLQAALDRPHGNDIARGKMLDRLAWAQWSVPEIASGQPFRRLMDIYQERQAA